MAWARSTQSAIFFFIAIAAGLALVNLIWIIPTFRGIRVSASMLALEIAERARADINASLTGSLRAMEQAGGEIAYEPERATLIMERILKWNPALRSVALLDRTGKEIIFLDRFQFIRPGDLRIRPEAPYLTRARSGSPGFGKVFVSEYLEPYLPIAVPVFRNGSVDSMLVADLSVRNLVATVQEFKARRGHIYVVDQDGYQILHPDLTDLLRRPNFFDREVVRKVILRYEVADGLAPEDAYADGQGVRVFTVGVPISVAGWGLFVEQPRTQALADERQIFLFATITTMLGILILIVVIQSNVRLTRLNATLSERNEESVIAAKILVRRDRDLAVANASLREILQDLENAGKMLVRRDLELTRANTRLEELDRIKSEFVSIAAHQLRTPLTGIRWSYQTLLDLETGALNQDQQRVLRTGLGATLRMIDLVNDLLSVARIEEGKFGILPRKQKIEPLIRSFAERYASYTREKGITFSFRMDQKNPLPDVAFDEEKMAIVLDNILDNALKYTAPGGTITLSVAAQDGRVKIEIADTGIGVPKSQIHRIFSKFFRADNALRFHTSGTGMGLYVARNILDGHAGSLDAHSIEGRGTNIVITLPAAVS